ncbi:MAG: corrinoid protein [Anaerolineae bacterium]|nr:corrinoid protein [Anaerolineae bacterium]
MSDESNSIFNAVVNGDIEGVASGVEAALKAGAAPDVLLQEQLIAAMDEVGEQFECGAFFVPEMLVAARAMQTGLNILHPLLVDTDVKSAGTVLIGTVKGDMHDIGKNLVGMMLQGSGFEVVDLGVDVAPETFVQKANKNEPKLVAISALLTTTAPQMEATVEAFRQAGLRDSVKIMVGGAPITQGFAEKIGADGYAVDAREAIRLARRLAEV